jgi:prefoldin subunit 5
MDEKDVRNIIAKLQEILDTIRVLKSRIDTMQQDIATIKSVLPRPTY